MRFADVNRQKIDVVSVIVVELSDVANLAAKGWSSEAAEYENERPAGSSLSNVKTRGTIQSDQARIGSFVAYLKMASMHVGQGVADHVESVFRTAGHNAKARVHDYEKHRQGQQDPLKSFGHQTSWCVETRSSSRSAL
jgi:hypothetical protein